VTMSSTPPPPPKTTFVEEQHLAMRLPQVQLPIRQSDWEHLRLLLRRCKTRERNFDGALWAAVSIAATALFSTLGFSVVRDTPEWLMRTAIAISLAAGAVAVVLAVVNRVFRSDKSASLDEALSYMEEFERAFPPDVKLLPPPKDS
jgi:hypothetical protein